MTTYDLSLLDTTVKSAEFDISSWATADTQIRFIGISSLLLGSFRIDNVAIEHDGGNTAPVAIANTVTTNEDNAYAFNVGDFTFSDVEGDTLISTTLSNPNLAGGTLEHSGGISVTNGMTLTTAQLATLIYTPATDANGSPLATFDFAVNDADSGVVTAQLAINVTSVNDAPSTNAAGAGGNQSATSISITLTGSDLDGSVDFFRLTGLPANGALYTDIGLTMLAATGVDYAASAEAVTLYFVPNPN